LIRELLKMGNDIIDGYFVINPLDPGVEEYGVVRIKTEDNCWYNVILHKGLQKGKNDWLIDFPDIQDETNGSLKNINLTLTQREELKEKILTYPKFRLPFLFI
jgi:hypothetical protein